MENRQNQRSGVRMLEANHVTMEKKAGNTSEKPSRPVPPNVHILSLSFLYFAAAALMFLTAMILGIRFIPDLITNTGFRSPAGWMLAHMLILGWMSMLAMGASFQLIQVILKTQLFSRSLGFVQFGMYALGLIVLLPSFYKGNLGDIGFGGSMVAAAVLLYAFNLAATMIRKRIWNVFVLGLSLSLLGFLITVGLGIGMGIIGESGRGIYLYDRLFASHLWFGLGSWMSGLIVTFSLKLLPMFYVSSKKADREAWCLVGLFQTGVWLQAVSIWLQSDAVKLVSLLFLAIAILLYLHFVYAVKKKAKPLGGTVPVVAHLNVLIAGVFGLWIVLEWFFPDSAASGRRTAAFVILLIVGWFSASILGYLAKIVPFLWWAYRFHTKWQKKSKILLVNMVPETRLQAELWLYIAAIGIVAASVVFSSPLWAVMGQAAAVILALVYAFEVSRVFRY